MKVRQIKRGWCKQTLHQQCRVMAILFMVVDAVYICLAAYLLSVAKRIFSEHIRKSATDLVYINLACFVVFLGMDCFLLYIICKKLGKHLVRWSVFGLVRAAVSLVLMVVFSVAVMDESLSDDIFAALMTAIACDLLIYVDAQLYFSLLVYNLGKQYRTKKVAFKEQKGEESKT